MSMAAVPLRPPRARWPDRAGRSRGPTRLDVVLAAGRRLQLFPELADEDVDDLELGFVHAAVEVLRNISLVGGALAQREQLHIWYSLLVRCTRWLFDLYRLGVEVHFQLAGLDHRLGVPLGAADDA